MPLQTLEMFTFAVGELLAHQRHHADIIENTERLTAVPPAVPSGTTPLHSILLFGCQVSTDGELWACYVEKAVR